MTLILTLVLGTVALTALFWALGLVLQGYFYSQPADRLPLRALVAGLAVAGFFTLWTYANTRATHKDKYGTLFEFTPTATRDVNEFDAVRKLAVKDDKGQPKETTTKYSWATEGRAGRFLDRASNKEFHLNDASSMTIALLVPDDDGKKLRFNALIDKGTYVANGDDRRFQEEGGSRYIDVGRDNSPRLMVIPSSGAFALAVLLNVGNILVWFAAFWPVLRFSFGLSLGLTAVFGAVSMVLVMPLLFNLNEVKPVPLVQQQAQPR